MKFSDLKNKIHKLPMDAQVVFISPQESEELISDLRNIYMQQNPKYQNKWEGVEIETRYLLSLGLLSYSGVSIEIKDRK